MPGPIPSAPARGLVLAVAAAALVLLAGCRVAETTEPPPLATSSSNQPVTASPSTPGITPTGTAAGQVLAVLRAWDSARAAAYRAGDAVALRRLYVPGSPLAAEDVAVLRSYGARRLRVTGLQQQVVSVEVHAARSRVVSLTVVERLAGHALQATAPAAGTSWRLPASGFERRVLRFERAGGVWRLSRARVE